jgi:hypothetical protein
MLGNYGVSKQLGISRSAQLHGVSYLPGAAGKPHLSLIFRSSVRSVVTGHGFADRGVGSSSPGRVKNFHFSIASKPAQGSPNLISNGYRKHFLRG